MKVVVTGAAGFVGQEIARLLHAAGHSFRMLVRDEAAPRVRETVRRFGAEARAANLLEAASLAGLCDGVTAVIHLVGIISEVGQNTFENAHIRATQSIVSAAKSAGARRFIHMSALGTRPNAASRYHQTKWAAEEAVRGSGLDWTIFRPSLIYGPHDHFVNLFARLIRLSPIVPILGSGEARLQPVTVANVARAFVGALGEPGAVGRTYDLCGRETFTLPELIDQILGVMGRRRWKWRVPAGLARAQAGVLEWAYPRLLGKAPPLNRDQLIMLQEDNVGEPQAADALFGLPPVRFGDEVAKYLRV